MIVELIDLQEAQPQQQMRAQEISIVVLYEQRHKYGNIPDFQREDCWNLLDKQMFIDTILRGLIVRPIEAYKEISETSETRYQVIDGQNRLKAIFDYREGKFATATPSQMRIVEPLIKPIEPGRKYAELGERARNIFNDFTIMIYSAELQDPSIAALMYRNGNKGKQLTLAEKLRSYRSQTTQFAAHLAQHPFWTKTYQGSHRRAERFRGGLQVIIMEAAKGPVSQHDRILHEYASGAKDALITDDFTQHIEYHLWEAQRLFQGVALKKPYEAIPLYQALLYLEKKGYHLPNLKAGCLASWFNTFQTKVQREVRYQGKASQFTRLQKLEEQRDFWKEHRPIIEDIAKRSTQKEQVHA